MKTPTCNAALIALACTLAAPASAQTAQAVQNTVRDIVSSAQLGAGYAQMVNLAATPDISAAYFNLQDSGTDIEVLRIPYEARWRPLSENADLHWRVAGGYLRQNTDFPVNVPSSGTGSISSEWTAYSLTGGLLAKIRLGMGFELVPGIDAGVARLENGADYGGAATILQPFLDGLLFNWHTYAWIVTPRIGLEWRKVEAARRINVRGRVARSWISSFGESDPVLEFSEAVNVYLIRADHAAPTGARVLERPLDWVVFAGYAGFFGANREALGFTSIAELGAGMESSVSAGSETSNRVRLGVSYLFGSGVTGWSVSLGLQY